MADYTKSIEDVFRAVYDPATKSLKVTNASGVFYTEVDAYANLPTPASSYTGKIYVVKTSTGVYLINRKERGLWRSTGTVWERLGDIPGYFSDANLKIYNDTDTTKEMSFNLSNIATSTLVTLTIPIASGTIATTTYVDNRQPVGAVEMFAGVSAPTGYLLCDGTSYLRADYPALNTLLAAVGGAGAYGWGSVDGTHFNVPDLRGAAPAGVGTSTGYTANEVVALGTKYNDTMQGHYHNVNANPSGSGGSLVPVVTAAVNTVGTIFISGAPASDGTNGTPRTGTVTKGKTVGINFIIKY